MAAPPSIDELRKLTLDELIAMRQLPEYADVAGTTAYQQALAEAQQAGQQQAPGYAPQRDAIASAATKLKVPTPAAVQVADAKATEVKGKATQVIDQYRTTGRVASVSDPALAAEVKKQVAATGDTHLANALVGVGTQFPAWLQTSSAFDASTNTSLYTPKQQKKVVTEYNKLVPPGLAATSWDDFLAKNQNPNEEGSTAVEFAGLAKPSQSHTFTLPDGKKYTIDSSDLQGLSTGTKFGPEQLSHVQDALNLAAKYNVRVQGPTGDLAWQPLFALQRLHTISLEESAPERSARPPRGPTSQTSHTIREADGSMTIAAGTGHGRVTGPSPADTAGALGKVVGAFARKENRTTQALTFQKNLAETGDPTLALIKTADPNLYLHVFRDGKVNPDSLAAAAAANQILVTADWGHLDAISYGTSQKVMTELSTFIQNPSAGAIGASITLPDPVKIEQTMKDFYNGWFGLDPSGAEFEAFKNDLYTKLRGTLPAVGQRINQDVDPAAQLRQFAEQSPQYGTLFGQKPQGVTADDYVNSNRQAVGTILGHDLSPQAVRAGQLTGQTQTAIGAAASSEQAKTSSSFQERLARAAQVVSANT